MATNSGYNYSVFDQPYNNNLERTDTLPSSGLSSTYGDDIIQNPGNVGEEVLGGKAFDNLVITSWIKSDNYRPKTHGFIIDGRLGYIECMQLYVGSGGIVGGSLDIPDYTSADSFHVDASGNLWLGVNTSGPITSAPAYILNDGTAKFTNVTVTGTSTVGGTLATTIGGAINVDGDLINEVINTKLNTDTQQILASYTFGASGAIAMATDVNNGLWLSPSGILGKKSGNTTFAITTSGDATFAGTLSAASGTFGTITAGSLTGTLTVGGTLATTIGGSINASGYFISQLVNDAINTNSRDILEGFDFGSTDYAGGVVAGTVAWNSSTGAVTGGSGVVLNRAGLIGANSGVTTFSINAATGSAYFAGSLASGLSIAAPIITGGTITGATFNVGTGVPGTDPLIYFRNSSNVIKGWIYHRATLTLPTGTFQALSINASETPSVNTQSLFLDASSGYINIGAQYLVPNREGGSAINHYFGTSTSPWYEASIKTVRLGASVNKPVTVDVTNTYLTFDGNKVCTGTADNGSLGTSIVNYFNDKVRVRRVVAGTNISLSTLVGGELQITSTGGSGTVTNVGTSGAISGGPITTTGTITHLTTAGYKHIPSGGSSDSILVYSSDGTATWDTTPTVAGLTITNYSTGLTLGSYVYAPVPLTVVTSINFAGLSYTTVSKDFLVH